jgi:hypothetical protein
MYTAWIGVHMITHNMSVMPSLSAERGCSRCGNGSMLTCHTGAAANALGDIVTSHLQVQTAWHCAHLLVHIKECLDLQQKSTEALLNIDA